MSLFRDHALPSDDLTTRLNDAVTVLSGNPLPYSVAKVGLRVCRPNTILVSTTCQYQYRKYITHDIAAQDLYALKEEFNWFLKISERFSDFMKDKEIIYSIWAEEREVCAEENGVIKYFI
ncbi:MAG: hypothetical protein H0X33_11780 [Taibaiella sp.]|nr:hypothetical protein [Taibaiella sp.]